MHLEDGVPEVDVTDAKGLPNHWILSRLERVKAEVAQATENYHFNDVAQTLYHFTWHEFCDWYLEMAKPDLQGDDEERKAMARKVLWTCLSELLVLMHPVMPFVTQEIWSHLPATDPDDVARAPYPAARPACEDAGAEQAMTVLQEAIVAVRTIRGELNIAPSVELTVLVRGTDAEALEVLERDVELMRRLAKVGETRFGADVEPPKASASQVVAAGELFVPLEGAVDFEAELARLDKEIAKEAKALEVVSRKLANEDFVAKAPPQVVIKEREKAEVARGKKDTLEQLKARLQSVMT